LTYRVLYVVAICLGALRTYSSALLAERSLSPRRCEMTSSMEGVSSFLLVTGDFGGRPVHTTPEIPRCFAQGSMNSTPKCPDDPDLVQNAAFAVLGSPSRLASASRASSNEEDDKVFQSAGHTVPCLHTTSVMRPSLDFRANSSGKFGPSSCHSCEIGKSPGSQINEPQPRQANTPKSIFLSVSMSVTDGLCHIFHSGLRIFKTSSIAQSSLKVARAFRCATFRILGVPPSGGPV